MAWITKARLKYVLAGVGVIYVILFAGYLVYAFVGGSSEQVGPSDLEAHPERQDEILAQRRLQEMRDRLKLTDEQTQRIADIMAAQQTAPQPDGDDSRGRWRETQEAIQQVLTPEQQALMEQERQSRGGPGGPRGMISQERADAFRQHMTPEQQQRFDKKLAEWEQRRQRRQGRGGGPGGR